MPIVNEILLYLYDYIWVVQVIFAVFVVFFERRNPASAWAWLFVIMFLPYVGFILYMMTGIDAKKHVTFAAKQRADEKCFGEIKALFCGEGEEPPAACPNLQQLLDAQSAYGLNDLVRLNDCDGHAALTIHNSVTAFHETRLKFDALFRDIKEARHSIHLLYYIFRDDEIGRELIALLGEKAGEGVEVRLMLDGMGSRLTRKRSLQAITRAGGLVCKFLPPVISRMNYRSHRKLGIIDGKIGYIGGTNVGDEYLGRKKRFGYWRDTHLRVEGDAVLELQARFIVDWNFSSKHKIKMSREYFAEAGTEALCAAQIVSSGPDTTWNGIQFAYTKLMSDAKKNIYISTPYFAPDDSIFETLRIAALSGVDVRIIIPGKPDHPFVYWASLSYLGDLLMAGARCFEYRKGFIHSKQIVVDGIVCSTGSANLDIRSFKLNFESNAFIYDRSLAADFEARFVADMGDCVEITKEMYLKRSRRVKIKESVSRLLSPIL